MARKCGTAGTAFTTAIIARELNPNHHHAASLLQLDETKTVCCVGWHKNFTTSDDARGS
jgi:hypothetical protein